MPGSLHQVGAAGDRRIRISAGIRRRLDDGGKGLSPDCQRPADGERPGDAIIGIHLMYRLDTVHEVVIQQRDVFVADACVRRIWHGGIQGVAARSNPMAHGPAEFVQRIIPDPRLTIGRDVGAVNRPDRRRDGQPAGESVSVSRRMAGRAVRRGGKIAAALDGCRLRRNPLSGHDRPRRGRPQRVRHHQDHGTHENQQCDPDGSGERFRPHRHLRCAPTRPDSSDIARESPSPPSSSTPRPCRWGCSRYSGGTRWRPAQKHWEYPRIADSD